MNANDKGVGLGVVASAATIANDIQQLQSIGGYLNAINTATAGLKSDSEAAGSASEANLANVVAPDILAAFNAIFGSSAGAPVDMASAASYAASDLSNLYAAYTALQTTSTEQQAQIAALQAQLGVKPGPTTAVPAANPNQMTTTTFLVGVTAVVGIVGGVWWVARNAKTKAKEAHAAGTFKPKTLDAAPAANPKRLASGSKR